MNLQNVYECERRRIDKFSKYLLLPSYFKTIGIALFIISFAFLIGFAILVESGEVVKTLARNVMLIALLLVALAKEPVEDELVEKLRGQAFSFAFITGVAFALFQPYINYVVAALVKPEKAIFAQLGDFVILWFMLCMYLCFFRLLKRTS